MISVFISYVLFWICKIFKKDNHFLRTPLEVASLGFSVVYFISIFVAVALHQAIVEWLKYCMYFAMFFMITDYVRTYKMKISLLWVLSSSAVAVSILGIDGFAGENITRICNAVFQTLNIDVQFFRLISLDRVASTFQYPNALAGYLMVMYFITLGLMCLSKKNLVKSIAGIFSFIILNTLVLTVSRAVYLLLPVISIMFLILMPKGSRMRIAANFLVSIIPAAVVALNLYSYIGDNNANVLKIWLLFLLGCAVAGLLTVLVNAMARFIEKINFKWIIAAVVVLLSGIVALAVFALNKSEPLDLSNLTDANKVQSVTKRISLSPYKQYKLVYTVDAELGSENITHSYYVRIYSRNKDNINFREGTLLEEFMDKNTDGIQTREIVFDVPYDSECLDIQFSTWYAGTKAIFDNATIIDMDTGKVVKNLVLKYKYLPDSIMIRLENMENTQSASMRMTYYKDALKIVADYLLLGAGGGAWNFLYNSYQSFYYTSEHVHNYFLELFVETGIIGMLALLAYIACLCFMAVKERYGKGDKETKNVILQMTLFTAIIAGFAHSVVDFDFSFAAILLQLWALVALFNAGYRRYVIEDRAANENEVKEEAKKMKKVLANLSSYAFTSLAIILLLISGTIRMGNIFSERSISEYEKGNISASINNMKKAQFFSPFTPEYKIDLANLIVNSENVTESDLEYANGIIAKAQKMVSKNSNLLATVGAYKTSIGEIQEGIKLFEKAAKLRPFRPEEWQQLANAYFSAYVAYIYNNDYINANSYINKTINLIYDAKDVNRRNLNPFTFNTETSEIIEKTKYLADNLGKGKNINLSSIWFYSVMEMDVNDNLIPDQWEYTNRNDVSIKYDQGSLIVKNMKESGAGILESRHINFEPGRTYVIEMELNNSEDIEKISYYITGMNTKYEPIKKTGEKYYSYFSVPEDYKPSTRNTLRLNINDVIEIKSLVIIG